MGMPLTTSDAAALEQYGRTIEARYCRACGACTGSCPGAVDLPEINRCLMYAEGYQNLALARTAYGELPREAALTACGSCETCTAKCAFNLNITERIEKARRLFA
jgi:predicted aldo/keto reductase-like oxidoreductase